MGCDGGSIPRREELVKLKKKAEKVDPAELERIKWFTCAMSNDRLKEPIVTCELGHLYNKEAVIRSLLDKNLDDKFHHIRNLKDLITPRFTPNPAFDPSSADTNTSASRSPFICPISQVEVGQLPFAIIRTCGCVLSERALREVPSTTCLQCGVAFSSEDIITLNPSPDSRAELRTRMETRRLQERGKKKEKREKKREKREKEKVKDMERAAEIGEGEEKKKEDVVTNGKEKKPQVLDKKNKKREAEAPAEHPTKSSKLSTSTTPSSSSSSSSSSKTTTATTTTSSRTTHMTYTAYVAPVGGDKSEEKGPAHISVPKTAAYNSMFNAEHKHKGANHLFSGIY